MNLTLRLDSGHLRRWHVRLAERLARRENVQVAVEFSSGGKPLLPSAIELLLTLERLIYGVPANDITAPATPDDLAQFRRGDASADRVLDFTAADSDANTPTWRVLFDGLSDDAAMFAALLEMRTPFVTIIDAATRAPVVHGHPGTEAVNVLTFALRDVMERTATLIAAAFDAAAARQVEGATRTSSLRTPAIASFALKSLARAAVRQLYRLCYNAPHWRVGWRFVDGPDVIDLRGHPPGGWRDLPDDRRRFYADPFPIAVDGRTFVFVEDFTHSLGYGVISALEFDDSGPLGTPRPVLDIGSHLSYPFVLAHDDAMWMVPESGATGTIDLYRAAAFPDRWVKEATLVSGIVASDATLFEHNGRWWMFATVRDNGGAYSDTLHIWSAPRLLGPWRPHTGNPVMVDIASARPAGRVVSRNDRLIRPFQDCRDGYGAALGLAEITRLDDEGFAQRVDIILRAGPLWPGRRLHTLNRAGRLECIDGSSTARRF